MQTEKLLAQLKKEGLPDWALFYVNKRLQGEEVRRHEHDPVDLKFCLSRKYIGTAQDLFLALSAISYSMQPNEALQAHVKTLRPAHLETLQKHSESCKVLVRSTSFSESAVCDVWHMLVNAFLLSGWQEGASSEAWSEASLPPTSSKKSYSEELMRQLKRIPFLDWEAIQDLNCNFLLDKRQSGLLSPKSEDVFFLNYMLLKAAASGKHTMICGVDSKNTQCLLMRKPSWVPRLLSKSQVNTAVCRLFCSSFQE